MRINSQHSGINIGFVSRLAFKYQKLTKIFLILFWVFINFIWEYFSSQYISCGKLFRLPR